MLPKTVLSVLILKQKLNPDITQEILTIIVYSLNFSLSAMPWITEHCWGGGIHVFQYAKVVARQRSQVNLSAAATEENIW